MGKGEAGHRFRRGAIHRYDGSFDHLSPTGRAWVLPNRTRYGTAYRWLYHGVFSRRFHRGANCTKPASLAGDGRIYRRKGQAVARENQDQDKTIITYLKLRDGTWIKGAQGEYQTEENYFLKNSILAVKISLKGENGNTYTRYFIAP